VLVRVMSTGTGTRGPSTSSTIRGIGALCSECSLYQVQVSVVLVLVPASTSTNDGTSTSTTDKYWLVLVPIQVLVYWLLLVC
jgi:hypothetical protein